MRLVMMPHLRPPMPGERDGGAVVRAVALGFDHRGGFDAEADLLLSTDLVQKAAVRSTWDEPDSAVGPYAIDVEENDLDLAGAVLRGESHGLILAGLAELAELAVPGNRVIAIRRRLAA